MNPDFTNQGIFIASIVINFLVIRIVILSFTLSTIVKAPVKCSFRYCLVDLVCLLLSFDRLINNPSGLQ